MISDCSLSDMRRLRVLSGDIPRLNPELDGGPSAFRPLEVDMTGSWESCCGIERTLFVLLLLPPGLNRELLLLWDFGERFEVEE